MSELEDEKWLEKYNALLESIPQEDAQKVLDHFSSYLEGKISLIELENIDPKLIQQVNHLGYMHLKSGKYSEAERIFSVLCFLDPSQALYQTALASAYQKQGKLDDALASYTLALQLDAQEMSAKVNRAEILYQMAYYNEAEQELQEALKLNKLDREAWKARAALLLKNIKEEKVKLGLDSQNTHKLFE